MAELGEERGYNHGLYNKTGSGEGDGESVHPNSPLVEQGSVTGAVERNQSKPPGSNQD